VTEGARSKYYGLHFGDTFKATRKLTVDYGIRWDLEMPTHEKYNNFSFLDWNGANPGAVPCKGSSARGVVRDA
jgi:hypothetical protein